VLLAGEPGAGKTRLAEDAVDRAGGLGMVCAWGRATEDGPPYWPFRQVFRALTDLAAPDAWPADGPAGEAARERFRLFEAVTDALLAAARPHGLLVVLDDLQWADSASVQLLVHKHLRGRRGLRARTPQGPAGPRLRRRHPRRRRQPARRPRRPA
jgi:predicted ATPase